MAQTKGASHRPLATSRLELNLVRLLCRCESMAAEKREPNEWRLEKVRDSYAPTEASNPKGRRAIFLATPLPVGCCTSSAAPPLGAQVLDAQVALPDLTPSCTGHSLCAPHDYMPLPRPVIPPPWAHPFLLQAVLGVLAWLTHSLPSQYVGALEDMLQALKIQAR